MAARGDGRGGFARRWIVPGAVSAVLLLSGCTQTASAPASTPIRSVVPAGASTPIATTPVPVPTPTESAVASVALKCGDLVPRTVLDGVSKGYVREKGYQPASDDPATELVGLGGTVCAYQNPTTGNTLEVAVAEPATKDATALKDQLVEHSNSVPTYGTEGYFQVVEGFGTVDAFPGDYWIYARSNDFYEPGDASAIVTAATKALKAHG